MINLNRIISYSDVLCRSHLRMNRFAFSKLRELVRDIGGLSDTRNMTVEEIVAIFLYTISHHKKNRCDSSYFYSSGETVSRQFHLCLMTILKLHDVLLKKPSPITEDCEDDKWKYFKNCLGALDGTMINVTVPSEDRSKYQTRKGSLAMNVLGVCSPELEFIYVLPGWEGSAHDGRVLRDAISRPNGLKVPRGCYYLCDGGYTNGDGFLTPHRGQLYHLREWRNGNRQPRSAEEYFNLRHASARNVIERCFGLLKGRWGILRSPSWFSLQTQGRIVLACCLLHNLIKKYMPPGSIYEDISDDDEELDVSEDDDLGVEYITSINVSNPWTSFRNEMAQTMFNNWRARRQRDDQ
ncbi:protein ALP1-like [Amaranthus tricolor]|uniref:protein ALP1-like n=1 Tax=Amaranthus tricolor TaxID=29722 RepID=UPI00258C1DBB|nr:protein ALP1-like [Amaranthus tricolor]